MSESKSSSSGGIGFFGLLTVAFIVLKLCGVIDWSWFWVLSPICICLAFAALCGSLYIAILVVEHRTKRRRQ
jgi:hypothetical protein